MSWQSIDFQGIVDLEPRIIEQLETFLDRQDNRLAHQLLHILDAHTLSTSAPQLPAGVSLTLSEAIEMFARKLPLLRTPAVSLTSSKEGRQFHAALWELTEMVEGISVELFQQVRQVPLNRWHLSLFPVVHAIYEMLMHRLEELLGAIKRLDQVLTKDEKTVGLRSAKWFKRRRDTSLDSRLIDNVKRTKTFLKVEYEAFQQRYRTYMRLSSQVEEALEAMKHFPIFAILDLPEQNVYVDIFRLLKILELNPQPKKEVGLDTISALKQLASVEHVLRIFQLYAQELTHAFFKSSLEWKSFDPKGENFNEAVKKLQEKVKDYQQELHQLTRTMSRYRLFMLKYDPNPYVRARLGFTEWIVGPEPFQAKQLLHMIYSAQELEGFFKQFFASLSRDPLLQQRIEHQARQQIDKLLYDMGQPLISRAMMRQRAEHLLEELARCDEVGSASLATIDYVEGVLAKAMREDWKYHVLHEYPLFHQLYFLHQGLGRRDGDPSHAFRLERFRLVFDRIQEWAKRGDLYAHVQEIELDINDMKTYLQDFLAGLQRIAKAELSHPFLDEKVQRLHRQLLEYRYLFGKFFLELTAKSTEGQQLRRQFLFVDQYFESADYFIYELKINKEESQIEEKGI